jgi:UDP-glucuronate 4-epimerase
MTILEGRPIDVFNHGNIVRDFTCIDDIVEGVVRVVDRPAEANPAFDPTPASRWASSARTCVGNSAPCASTTPP